MPKIGILLVIIISILNCSWPESKRARANDFLKSLNIETLQELDGINQLIILSLNEGSLKLPDVPGLVRGIVLRRLSHYLNSLGALEVPHKDFKPLFDSVLNLARSFEKRMVMNFTGNLGDREGETLLNQIVLDEREYARRIVSELREVTQKWGIKRDDIENKYWAGLLENGRWPDAPSPESPSDFKCDPSDPIGEEALQVMAKNLSEHDIVSATKTAYCAFKTACHAMKAPFRDNHPAGRAVRQQAMVHVLGMAKILRTVGLAKEALGCLAVAYSMDFNDRGYPLFPEGDYYDEYKKSLEVVAKNIGPIFFGEE